MKNKSTQIICVTGPESSGKTTLAQWLAGELKTKFVSEYARIYLAARDNHYAFDDLKVIARRQEALIRNMQRKAGDVIVADTNVQVVYIWSQFRYGRVAPEIQQLWRQQRQVHYLLCYPDIPWTPDPQRESPNLEERLELYGYYLKMLTRENCLFSVVRGSEENRRRLALEALTRNSQK